MMNDFRTEDHWQFAKAWAIHGLTELIREFDFAKRTGNGYHAFTGVSPEGLLATIDAFLAEDDSVVFGAERTTLGNLRQIVIEQVLPAYEAGKVAAIKHWQTSGDRYGETLPEVVMAQAKEVAPKTEIEQNWFVEAFCKTWAEQEFNAIVSEIRCSDSESPST